MDADGLPLVGAGVDYEKLAAIEQKRMVAFLNHFIMHTARFLNRFSNTCEEKLGVISTRIDRLDTVLKNLESKLNSVPGLENIQPSSTPAPADVAAPANPPTSLPTTTVTVVESGANNKPEDVVDEPVNEDVTPVCKDPRYAKYFKMLNMGVPAVAVQNKMRMEGMDADLLDTPNAPAPPAAQSKDDSDDGFSDSDGSFSD